MDDVVAEVEDLSGRVAAGGRRRSRRRARPGGDAPGARRSPGADGVSLGLVGELARDLVEEA
jgi:hypothetical protein